MHSLAARRVDCRVRRRHGLGREWAGARLVRPVLGWRNFARIRTPRRPGAAQHRRV